MKAICSMCKKEVTDVTCFHIITPYHVVQNITEEEPDISYCDDCWDLITKLRIKNGRIVWFDGSQLEKGRV